MKVKKQFPSGTVGLLTNFPEVIDFVINLFRNNDIHVYEDTIEYDKDFPLLYWDVEELSQIADIDDCDEKLSLEEFLSLFFENEKTYSLKISEDYSADIKKDGIHVGCQVIEFDTFDKLVDLVKEFKEDDKK